MNTDLKPVTKGNPCAICQGDHKCSRGEDGLHMCGRCSEKVAGFVLMGKAEGDEQFSLYREKDDPALSNNTTPYHRNGAVKFASSSLPSNHKLNGKAGIDWEAKIKEHAARMGAAARTRLADVLGLPEGVLGRLRIGCGQDKDGGYYGFPEYDGERRAIGIVR
jgi:putative DNA primase/helicase